MRIDFLNQASLEAGLTLPPDALGHQPIAERLLAWSSQMPPGSVIAVQGDWGRGKTDVLARVAAQTVRDPGPAGPALWLNPWQYGTPDLLTPLVAALKERAGKKLDSALQAAGDRLVQAGLNFGLKAVGGVMPGGQVLQLAAPAVGELAGRMLAARREGGPADPVVAMARDFRELAQAALQDYSQAGTRLLVCVDDLDRCLPARQVALLQGLRFLLAAGAPVTLLVALDPTLAREGVRQHYGNPRVDADRYLDKMFDLRVSLPGLGDRAVESLLRLALERPLLTSQGDRPLHSLLPAAYLNVGVGQIAPVGALRNPRVLTRLVDKLRILSATSDLPAPPSPQEAGSLLLWMALGERWPEHRALIQSAASFEGRLSGVARQVGQDSGQAYDGDPAVQALSPDPSLAVVLERLLQGDMAWLSRAAAALGELGV